MPRRAPKGEKEKKVGMEAAGFGWVMFAFNFATEASDAIKAIGKSLPCSLQKDLKGKRPAGQLEHIINNFEHIDPEAMVSELILNHFEDMIIGRKEALKSKAFGSGESWSNYYRKVGRDKGGGTGDKEFAKGLQEGLDAIAADLGLKRVQCGRK